MRRANFFDVLINHSGDFEVVGPISSTPGMSEEARMGHLPDSDSALNISIS
jgi:hypothetical protein